MKRKFLAFLLTVSLCMSGGGIAAVVQAGNMGETQLQPETQSESHTGPDAESEIQNGTEGETAWAGTEAAVGAADSEESEKKTASGTLEPETEPASGTLESETEPASGTLESETDTGIASGIPESETETEPVSGTLVPGTESGSSTLESETDTESGNSIPESETETEPVSGTLVPVTDADGNVLESETNTEGNGILPETSRIQGAALPIQQYSAGILSDVTNIETNISYQEDSLSWPGTGSADDPKTKTGDTTNSRFTARTVDAQATINGNINTYTRQLDYGENVFDLEVVSSDGSKATNYRITVNRNKKAQNNTPPFYLFTIIAATTGDSQDGGIVGFDPDKKYDYQRQGDTEWKPVPDNADRIQNLSAGTYFVRYGETDDTRAGINSVKVEVPVQNPRTIEIGSGLQQFLDSNHIQLSFPQSATSGENVTISAVLPVNTYMITGVDWSQKVTTSGGFSASGTFTGACSVTGNPTDGYLYEYTFTMNNYDLILENIVLEQSSYYMVRLDDIYKFILNIEVTPSDRNEVITNGYMTNYKENAGITVKITPVQSGSYSVDRVFAVNDLDGQELYSQIGSELVFNIGANITVRADLTPIPADFDALNIVRKKIPADLTMLEYSSMLEISNLLTTEANIRKLLKGSQSFVDDYVQRLSDAVYRMKYRPAVLDEINGQKQRIPSDLSIYKPEQVNKLNDALKAAQEPIDDNWDIRRQNEVDALAGDLRSAIDALEKIPAPTPDAPELISVTDTTIIVKEVSGQEYSADNGATWQQSGVFSGLSPASDYEIVTRVSETATSGCSLSSSPVKAATDKSKVTAPQTPELLEATADSVTVKSVDGQEYSIDGGKTWQDSGKFEKLDSSKKYTVITRIKETNTAYASPYSGALEVSTDSLPVESETMEPETETEEVTEPETETDTDQPETETDQNESEIKQSESEITQTESETKQTESEVKKNQDETKKQVTDTQPDTKNAVSNPVKTGDSTPIAFYIGILSLAVLLFAAFLLIRRRRN